jgi:hypothetical protein
MADAESPATLFELLYSRFPEDAKIRMSYYHACNASHYVLNREAVFVKNLDWYINALHYSGVTSSTLARKTNIS